MSATAGVRRRVVDLVSPAHLSLAPVYGKNTRTGLPEAGYTIGG
jgi:hypothetical protein